MTESELFKILNLDLSKKSHLEKVRDAFCFGCFTGQRFSDISNISWNAIKNDIWEIRTQKTRDIIQVSLNRHALKIINKNKSKEKPVMTFTNQRMNGYLKEIAELAEINDKVKIVNYRGNEKRGTLRKEIECNLNAHGKENVCYTIARKRYEAGNRHGNYWSEEL